MAPYNTTSLFFFFGSSSPWNRAQRFQYLVIRVGCVVSPVADFNDSCECRLNFWLEMDESWEKSTVQTRSFTSDAIAGAVIVIHGGSCLVCLILVHEYSSRSYPAPVTLALSSLSSSYNTGKECEEHEYRCYQRGPRKLGKTRELNTCE